MLPEVNRPAVAGLDPSDFHNPGALPPGFEMNAAPLALNRLPVRAVFSSRKATA